jgi:flagellar hook protein FlgE
MLEFRHNSASTGVFTETTPADGESAVTSAIVYDSLGNEHLVTLTMVLAARTNSSSTWRWYADCVDDTDTALDVGNGTVTFGTNGAFTSESGGLIRIDLSVMGVATQLVVNPDFELLTQFADSLGSEINVRSQDGAPMGVMTSYAIGENGVVTGLFTNGLSENIGQICITKFANPNGLLRDAANLFSAAQNSGLAQDGVAAGSGRGYVRAGALESSNVDIAKEFTDMIVTQRGFQANARTITTSDQMLQELINLTR